MRAKVHKADVRVGLRVLLEAKPEKVEEVRSLLVVRLALFSSGRARAQFFTVTVRSFNGRSRNLHAAVVRDPHGWN